MCETLRQRIRLGKGKLSSGWVIYFSFESQSIPQPFSCESNTKAKGLAHWYKGRRLFEAPQTFFAKPLRVGCDRLCLAQLGNNVRLSKVAS